MRKIFKYEFEIEKRFSLNLPMVNEIVHVECQDGTPCIWAIVDPDVATEPTDFRVVGTGHPIEDDEYDTLYHQGTFQQGPFVWHLFQVLKED